MHAGRSPAADRGRVIAVLGPTNTGKTHLAMERMLGHGSGMIGFPLRLLARENYDRAVQAKGTAQVALITGEEKILPPAARYFLCTVESMPVDRAVDFLAIDEIQLCADPERGHLFTDRLLHARGRAETMLLGAETARPLLRRLVPEAEMQTRPRFSTLSYTGPCKLSRLPARSAIVAFSVAEVYAIAELVRRQRGGAAIVLGALSPRTRNAQVAMYQAGEVDYLVATDAIGMGLNMHVDHVAFAATRKFDGRAPRALTAAELAQIAGRAGRYTRDGSFGTTADIGPLDADAAERIEAHRFEPPAAFFWRNSDLPFVSLAALRAALSRAPARPGLVRAREADDERALAALAREADIVDAACGPERVRLLWDVCQIPDFGKVAGDGHARLLGQIYRFLVGLGEAAGGRLPTDWVARQVDRINRTDGDIEALTQRIANIRTWTFVSHRADWLADARAWQERTRAIEDRLSDALHQRLIHRFVDRRTASLVGRMKDRGDLVATVTADDAVLVEGHFVGVLEGFRFVPDRGREGDSAGEAGRAVTAAALRALRGEIGRRLKALAAADDDAITLAADGGILWRGACVARLRPGPDILRPQVSVVATDLLDPAQRELLRQRLTAWMMRHIAARLAPLVTVPPAAVTGPARGLLFQVGEALGSLPRSAVMAQIASLSPAHRAALKALGLRIGAGHVYFPSLLKPAAVRLRALLWCLAAGRPPLSPPPADRTSVALDPAVPPAFVAACGFRPLASRAVRIDIAERLIQLARRHTGDDPASLQRTAASLLGCSAEQVVGVLAALGFEMRATADGVVLGAAAPLRRNGSKRGRRRQAGRGDSESPFAKLTVLTAGR